MKMNTDLFIEANNQTIAVGDIVQERVTSRKYIVSRVVHATDADNLSGSAYVLGIPYWKVKPDESSTGSDGDRPLFTPSKLMVHSIKRCEHEGKRLITFLERKVDESLAIKDEQQFLHFSRLLNEARNKLLFSKVVKRTV